MKISDQIQSAINNIFRRGAVIPKSYKAGADLYEPRLPFADTVFLNCCELLTDLANDVELTTSNMADPLFVAFRAFFNAYGKIALTRLFDTGYVVVGHTQTGEGPTASHYFRMLYSTEFRKIDQSDEIVFEPTVAGVDLYVLRSSAFACTGRSDKQLCRPYLDFLDNVLNASNTVSARLGAVVVASPKNVTSAPAPVVLRKEEKEQLEKEIGENYGALTQQKQLLLLPREMTFQVVSLATLDQHTEAKARLAILAIADRLKVPANQIGAIDATSSKSLANGTELREGDYNKYQSFERLLNQTFVQMGADMGLRIDYTIYNKPQRQQATI